MRATRPSGPGHAVLAPTPCDPRSMEPFGGDGPVVVGHRGAPLLAPENTPASFAAAAATGADWVELDVRPCADGLVVHHDARTADGTPLGERTVAQLGSAGITALKAVLDGLPEGLGVDVEVKNAPGEPGHRPGVSLGGAVAEVLRPAAAVRPVCTTSFDVPTVAALVGHLPDVPVGLLAGPRVRAGSALALADELGARVVCPHALTWGLGPASVAAAHQRGIAVLVWTVDRPARARALAAAGVDAICTNDPGLMAATLRGPDSGARDVSDP